MEDETGPIIFLWNPPGEFYGTPRDNVEKLTFGIGHFRPAGSYSPGDIVSRRGQTSGQIRRQPRFTAAFNARGPAITRLSSIGEAIKRE